jgi:phospholipase/carboxylesterase
MGVTVGAVLLLTIALHTHAQPLVLSDKETQALLAPVVRPAVLAVPQSSYDSLARSIANIVAPYAEDGVPGGGGGSGAGSPPSGAAGAGRRVAGDSHGGAGLTFTPTAAGPARGSVVLLHGMDTTAEQIAPIVAIAQASGLAGTRFILPQAPSAYVDYLQNSVVSWFNMGSNDETTGEYPDEILAAVARIERIVQGEYKAGIRPRKVAVVGMSQGGALATTIYMRSAAQLGGAVGVSTWLPLLDTYPAAQSAANAKLDILMIHGSQDDAVRLPVAQASVEKMKRSGRNATLNVINGAGHLLGNDLVPAASSVFEYLKAHGFD